MSPEKESEKLLNNRTNLEFQADGNLSKVDFSAIEVMHKIVQFKSAMSQKYSPDFFDMLKNITFTIFKIIHACMYSNLFISKPIFIKKF